MTTWSPGRPKESWVNWKTGYNLAFAPFNPLLYHLACAVGVGVCKIHAPGFSKMSTGRTTLFLLLLCIGLFWPSVPHRPGSIDLVVAHCHSMASHQRRGRSSKQYWSDQKKIFCTCTTPWLKIIQRHLEGLSVTPQPLSALTPLVQIWVFAGHKVSSCWSQRKQVLLFKATLERQTNKTAKTASSKQPRGPTKCHQGWPSLSKKKAGSFMCLFCNHAPCQVFRHQYAVYKWPEDEPVKLNVSRLAWKDLVFPLTRKFHPPKTLFAESAIEAYFFLTIWPFLLIARELRSLRIH